ncbi:MAG: ImmA/IrrE family metallo-endopeptidase, partial [Phycisphaerales bacterium]
VSRGGRISIRVGLEPANEFSTIVHELAHELLHRGEDRKTISKTVRETEAEAVAFVVTSAIGLNTGTAASDYIQLYQGNAETLAASLDRIQHVAAGIIAATGQPDQKGNAQPEAA